MLRGARGLVVFLGGALAIIVAAIWFGFQDQKGEARTARDFLTLSAAGDYDAARALLHEGTAVSMPPGRLQQIFEGLAPFADMSFNSFSWSSSGSVRQSTIRGTGTTATDCESVLEFEFLNGEITRFSISPLCPADDIAL